MGKRQQLQFIKKAEVIRVATADKKGKPQVTPVCHVVWRGKIYFATDYTKKLINIKQNPQIALVADIYQSSWKNLRGVMVQGKARIIRRGPLFRKIRELLYRKYKPYRTSAPFDEMGSPIIEIIPSKLVDWWF